MKLFIGCSSSDYIEEKYNIECQNLLLDLFKDNNDLIFGASDTGIMGLSYRIAKNNNRKVIGICPEVYKEDFKKLKCDKEIITKTVGERTNDLIEQSDILIFLPGGVGTIYELLSAIESKRSHEYNKPIIIYNMYHYFDELLITLEKTYHENFTSLKVKENYVVFNNKKDILEYIKESQKNKLS